MASSDEQILVDFGGLVLSFGTAAMIALGKMPEPESGKMLLDLHAAKYNVDILLMLSQKTKGNLSVEEEQLLKKLLFDLQMMYVDAEKG